MWYHVRATYVTSPYPLLAFHAAAWRLPLRPLEREAVCGTDSVWLC